MIKRLALRTANGRAQRRNLNLPRALGAITASVGLAALGSVSAIAPAAAEPIEHGHFHDVESSEIQGLCGDLTVRVDADTRGMFLVNTKGSDGAIYGGETVHGSVKITNLASGKAFTNVVTFVSKDLKVTDNGNGTLTITSILNGNFKTYGPDGALLFRDTGQERSVALVDDGGTPSDPSDDEVISEERVKDTGWVFPDDDEFCVAYRTLTN